jgi:DNA-binding MarR family transcriptional regulator
MSITTRRLPTRDELRIWRDYIETADALRAVLGARLQGDSGLSSGDYTVLLALSEADAHRLRSSTLAAQIGWERSRLSHHLGRMERRGLIAREDCPTDNRGAEIVLTGTGAKLFKDSNGPHLRAIREVFVDALTAEQIIAAGEVASALRTHLADQT